jgi:hypothetical protein
MKRQIAVPFAALVLAAAFIAGCGKSANFATPSQTPTPVPTPTIACATPAGTTIELAYPIPGATGVPSLLTVPATNGIMLLVAPSPLPTNWYVYVKSANGVAAQTGPTATPTTLPTPIAPQPSGFVYQYFDIGQFAVSTTFQVFAANVQCYPGLELGSFTTGTS